MVGAGPSSAVRLHDLGRARPHVSAAVAPLRRRVPVRVAIPSENVAMVRLLFTCRPLAGHYEPLLPLASAAQDADHAVAFATGAPVVARARRDGFDALPAGPGEDFRAEWGPRFPGWDRLVGDEQRRFVFTEIFANLELAPRADDLDRALDGGVPTWSFTR